MSTRLRFRVVTQDSIARTRLFLWTVAAEAWGFAMTPPLDESDLVDLSRGKFSFRAARQAEIDGVTREVVLEVGEVWEHGDDPLEDRRLEADGCFLLASSWMVQVSDGGDLGAERIDVVMEPDAAHPRVHRHSYGQPNGVRVVVPDLPVPDAWLAQINAALGGVLADGYDHWDDLPEEDEAEYVD
jgi:hypothetical protein